MTAAIALVTCASCGTTVPRRSPTQRTCGAAKCRDKLRVMTPERIVASRARCEAWARVHRGVTRSNPWLRGAPPFDLYLPGGGTELRIDPPPRWPIELRNTRALHGMLTALSGVPHGEHAPRFTLLPLTGRVGAWGVYWADRGVAIRLASKSHPCVLFDREVTVTCGPMVRAKAPTLTKPRGHRYIRLDAVTPVCIRHGGQEAHLLPTSGNLASTLATWLPPRLGLELAPDAVQIKIHERHTQAEWVDMGDKYGRVGGWVGHMILDCNATAEWLLRCAETMGLGGRVAFGFGRVRVMGA